MDDLYMLSDPLILAKIGANLKAVRLRQNITQQSLADAACVSLSTIKKIEKGEIRTFDAFIRVIRILGKLDVLMPLVQEEQLSPSEYYEFVRKAKRHRRQRAVGHLNTTKTQPSSW